MAMTMQLMAMRSYEPTMYIKDDIFEAALEILKVLLEHSYRMIVVENSRVPKEFVIPKPVLTEESLYSKFVSALPKEFTRTDAINIGIDLGMASGSVDVYISRMKKKGLATVENGKYIKQI
jgi:DNA-binding transcriptional regulator PaaX